MKLLRLKVNSSDSSFYFKLIYIIEFSLYILLRLGVLAAMSSSSSKHRPSKHKDKGTILSEKSEANLANVKNNLVLLDNMLSERPREWEQWLSTARSAMRAIDAMSFLKDTGRLQEQVWLIQVLQDYSFHDADEGCIRDISRWCQSSWLRVLRDHPDNATILKGMIAKSRLKFQANAF